MKIKRLPFQDVHDVSHDVQNIWETAYSQSKFHSSKAFDGPINPATNRHLQNDSFRREPKMKAFVNVFETSYRHLRVNSVWLIKKSKEIGGFQSWHGDYFPSGPWGLQSDGHHGWGGLIKMAGRKQT